MRQQSEALLPLVPEGRRAAMADDRALARLESVVAQGVRLPIGEDAAIRRHGARKQTLDIWEANRADRGECGHDLPQTCSCKGRGARPAFALEGLREIVREHRAYESAKPGPGRQCPPDADALELIETLGR